jgi:hypothetical protein
MCTTQLLLSITELGQVHHFLIGSNIKEVLLLMIDKQILNAKIGPCSTTLYALTSSIYQLVSHLTHTQAVHPHFAAAFGMSGIRGTCSA